MPQGISAVRRTNGLYPFFFFGYSFSLFLILSTKHLAYSLFVHAQCTILFVHKTVVDSVHAAFIKRYLKHFTLGYGVQYGPQLYIKLQVCIMKYF